MTRHPDFILKKPHSKDCEGLRQVRIGRWETPYCLSGESADNFDGAGRRMNRRISTHGWLLVECNDSDCKAWGILREAAALRLCVEAGSSAPVAGSKPRGSLTR